MALRTIRSQQDPILRLKCKPVKEFTSALSCLIDDMKETMTKNNGIGLAAPQVGIVKRIIVVEHEDKILELVNPVIVSQKGQAIGEEGCLSVKGIFGNVKRPTEIVVEAMDRNGKPFKLVAKDLLARVICHEVDHLDGILFIDKMEKIAQ